jgi:heme exporter protein D
VSSGIDLSSWRALLSTLVGLAVVTLVIVGIRLLVMQTIQQRRERHNRQINERLRTLIAAYKTLGGSFTGDLAVDPAHLRDLRVKTDSEAVTASQAASAGSAVTAGLSTTGIPSTVSEAPGAERRRRVRDAVEAALSDVILLGTEEQVRLAVRAASDLVAGRPVATAELVVSLRTFIRDVLDLDPVPVELVIPKQGPLRPAGSASGRGGRSEGGSGKAGTGGRAGQGGDGSGTGGVGLAGGLDTDGGSSG